MATNPVLSDRQARELLRRQHRDVPPSVDEQRAHPVGIEKELTELRKLIRDHGRSGKTVELLATKNHFIAMFHLNHPKNRPLRQNRVLWWKAAREEWRWLDYAPFVFDWDGWMRDGQHRAAAFAQLDEPLKIDIKFGVDPQTFAAIDTGMPRSAAQNLSLRGIQHGGTVRSIVAFKYRLEHGGLIPDPQQIEILGEQMADDLLTRAMVCSSKLYRAFKTPQSSSALAYWLIARNSRRKLSVDEFWDALSPIDSYGLAKGSPIDLLRKKLRAEQGLAKQRGQYLYQTQQTAWIILAWNAWINDGHPVFRWEKQHELSPIDSKR